MTDLRIKKILAPVDLGHSSEAALRHARDLATRFGSHLTVFYANDALTLQSYDEIYTGYRELPEDQSEMMEEAVRAYARPLMGDLLFDVLVVADDTPRAIATAAGRRDADLIVMGTHGRSNWEKFMTGSVAEAVLHATDRPVLAVPQDSRAGTVATVLCPINFTPAAESAVKAACCLSKAFGAELNVLHVVSRESEGSHMDGLREKIRSWLDPVVEPWCEFRQLVVRGHDVADHILEWAERVGAGYLVVGAHKKTVTHARATVGTTAERLLRTASIPILSVLHPPAGVPERQEQQTVVA